MGDHRVNPSELVLIPLIRRVDVGGAFFFVSWSSELKINMIIKFIYSVKEATKKKTIFSIVIHLLPGAYVVIYLGNLYVVASKTLLLCNLAVL